MAEQIVGIVEEVMDNGKGKGSGLRVGGKKYGVYDPAASRLGDVNVGDNVSFRYTEKTGSGGIVYKNVQGVITPTSAPATATAAAAPNNKNYRNGNFPIDPLDGQRSIIRQNALTNAVKSLSIEDDCIASDKIDEYADSVIALARRFEAYTAGDMDRQKAMEMANALDAGDE